MAFVQHVIHFERNDVAQRLVGTLDALFEKMQSMQEVLLLLLATEAVIFECYTGWNYDFSEHRQKGSERCFPRLDNQFLTENFLQKVFVKTIIFVIKSSIYILNYSQLEIFVFVHFICDYTFARLLLVSSVRHDSSHHLSIFL